MMDGLGIVIAMYTLRSRHTPCYSKETHQAKIVEG